MVSIVYATSNLAQLWVQDRYQEAETSSTQWYEADQEQKCQKQADTCDAFREWLPGELFSGSECWKVL